MTASPNKELPKWLPFVVGFLLVIQFVGLATWQFTKGWNKSAERDMYLDSADGRPYTSGMEVAPYQSLKATGRFDNDRQMLLDNFVIEGTVGYYVITPFVPDTGGPTILVNRGWIPRHRSTPEQPNIEVDASSPTTISGRAGSLPKPGLKMGEPFTPGQDWPKIGVYPNAAEVAAELGEPLDPVVFLLDPQDPNGYFRQWEPEEMSAGRHFAYALQWFAMAAVLSALLIYHRRRSAARHD
ncbi:MAG: SURF1 family protein [Pseudomonadota bacterium]